MACRIVAAFDFGTTYSGYAFSFYDKPIAVWSNQAWESAPEEIISMKTATSLLLNPAGEFEKFGYDAEVKYACLSDEKVQDGWRLFRQFKMMLHNNKTLSPTTTVDDVNGHPLQALTVFALSLSYLRSQLLDAVQGLIKDQKGVDMSQIDFLYVITVPAIWDDAARQFMREAASLAGMEASRVKLVLEPEAASAWGQSITAEKLSLSVTGTQYMVIDLGGGTADISVHEKKADGTLREVHTSTGGPWGGRYVDENFLNVLRVIFGAEIVEQLKAESAGEYLRTLREFENQKTKFNSNTSDKMTFYIPTFIHSYIKSPDASAKEKLSSLGYDNKIIIEKDAILVDPEIVKKWFDVPVDSLIDHVTELLCESKLSGVGTVLLVGGFGENMYVQDKLKQSLETLNRKLIVPDDAGLIVLKGAVRCGHIPNLISSKIRRYANNQDKPYSLFSNLHTS